RATSSDARATSTAIRSTSGSACSSRSRICSNSSSAAAYPSSLTGVGSLILFSWRGGERGLGRRCCGRFGRLAGPIGGDLGRRDRAGDGSVGDAGGDDGAGAEPGDRADGPTVVVGGD